MSFRNGRYSPRFEKTLSFISNLASTKWSCLPVPAVFKVNTAIGTALDTGAV